jgi:uncharacterized membrane protein YdjX (TVP38/TMEM64 family)
MRRILNWRLALLLGVVSLAGTALLFLPALRASLADLARWVQDHRSVGALVLAALYIPAAVLFVPGSLITLVAGFALGLWVGVLAMSIGSTLGACAAFWAGRTIARGWVEKRITGNPRFQALDEGVAREGFKIVLLTRLSPAFPYNLLNYAFGLTRVRFRDYAVASWLGMLPGTFLYVYLGTTVGEIARLSTGEVQAGDLERLLLFGVGLVATVAVTIVLTRIARAALKKAALDPAPAMPTEPVHDAPQSSASP